MYRLAKCVTFIGLFLLALSGSLLNAQTASLAGVVTDSSGGVVPGATVTCTHTEKNIEVTATTDAGGRYILRNLSLGRHAVEVRAPGFTTFRQQGIELTVDFAGTLDVELSVGDISQTIEVVAEVSRVDTRTSSLQQLVDTARVEELPLNGRDIYQLAKLVPGTGSSGFNIGGGRSGTWGTTTNVRLDGGTNTDGAWFRVLPSPSPDAVKEFSIQTNLPSAKYGWSAGVVEVATRSGTNELHGTLYEFFRNDALDARNFFAAEPTRRKRNQFGAAVGGPVYIPKVVDGRDKLFWFLNVEKHKEPLNGIGTFFSPSEAQRQGDFSALGEEIVDPLSGDIFPNSMVPADRLDRIAQNVVSELVPLPQDATGVYRHQYPLDVDRSQIMGRVDLVLGAHQLMWRTFWSDEGSQRIRGNLPGFAEDRINRSIIDTVSLTSVVTPQLLNVVRFSRTDYRAGRDGIQGLDVNYDLDKLRSMGWSDDFYSPVASFPEMNVSGFFTAGNIFINWADSGESYSIEDEASWHTGAHSIDFGFRWGRVTQRKIDEGIRAAGAYAFNGQATGAGITDFYLGNPSTFIQQGLTNLKNRSDSFSFYGQDTIKLSKKITLNLGMRYELPLAARNLLDHASFFFPGSDVQSQRFVNAPPGLLFYGDPGMPRTSRKTPTTLFGPRVGLAYAVNDKTVIRMGYGLYYNPSWLQLESHFSERQPFLHRVDLNDPGSISDPWQDFPGGNPFPGAFSSGDPNYVFRTPLGRANAPGFTEPRMHQWNFNIQREVSNDYLLKAAYVATHGTHLLLRNDINAALYVPGDSTLGNLNDRRPYAPMAAIDWLVSGGNSSYQSAQFSMDKRLSQDFSVLASYTFSKALDMASTGWPNYPQDVNDYGAEWGPAGFDQTHAFITSWVWSVPTPTRLGGFGRYVLGGWELSGIFSYYSGTPLSLTNSRDQALRGLSNRPDRLRDARLDSGRDKGDVINEYFDTSAYAPNALGQFGSAPRTDSQLRSLGRIGMDAGVLKHFPITERQRIQFRAEFFNLPNHANLNSPGTNINSASSFGRITGASEPRIIQFALKYMF